MAFISFPELRKLSRRNAQQLPAFPIALMGDCATQHLATAIRGYGIHENLNLPLFEGEYNQIDSLTLDPGSELYASAPQAVVIQLCSEKLYEAFCAAPAASRSSFAETTCIRIRQIWGRINANIHTTILQCNFPLLDDGTFGQFGSCTDASFLFQQRKLNVLLMEAAQESKNVRIVDLDALQTRVGRNTFADPKLYYIGKIPISMEILPQAAKAVVDIIQSLRGCGKKCVILDLDNTLWGGVIGDDGISGIQIGELGLGHAFSDFQAWLKELKNRGILLAVCSKNNESTAKEPFEKHPEMILRLEDFSIFVANWQDKAQNIRDIQKALNIGMDSMVFLDDNPFERNLVRGMIPEITVPELPEDPALYLSYLRSLNLFETASFSGEDSGRTEQYRVQAERSLFETKFSSYEEYLQGLQMKAAAAPFDPFHYPRIAQLTQRSNQFNFRTGRYTEAEIEAVAQSRQHLTLYFTLRDAFGSYGLISVVILEKKSPDTLFIAQWLMSCRVLNRGMEAFIVNKILETAEQNGFRIVEGEYIPTAKNAMVRSLYEKMGFVPAGENRFTAQVQGFAYHKTYIEEECLSNDQTENL